MSSLVSPHTMTAADLKDNLHDIQDVIRFASAIGWGVSVVPVHVSTPDKPRGFQTFDDEAVVTFPRERYAEVKKAATALFAKLDPDHDSTLDAREMRGRLTAKEVASADPDQDGTLTLDPARIKTVPDLVAFVKEKEARFAAATEGDESAYLALQRALAACDIGSSQAGPTDRGAL